MKLQQREAPTRNTINSFAESVATNGEDAKSNASDSNKFSSRWTYWISAIGFAVGFGNVWRFPHVVYSSGGGAFFIPFILCLFLIITPVTILEYGLGQISQLGHVGAFKSLGRIPSAVGLGCLSSLSIVVYYVLLLSWAMIFAVNSFSAELPWLYTQDESESCRAQTAELSCSVASICQWSDVTETCAASHFLKSQNFFADALSYKDDFRSGITHLNGQVLGGMIVTWVVVFFATSGGAKIFGYVNYVSTGAPMCMVLLLAIFGGTLKGAGAGISEYFSVDFAKVFEPSVWNSALGQAIFTMGATEGPMVAYASHNNRGQNFVADSVMVACADMVFAVIAGFAVFSVIGHVALDSGLTLDALNEQKLIEGSTLAFRTYPIGLGVALGTPWGNILTFFFFITLWLLGVSSAIGFLEAVSLVIQQSRWFQSFSRTKPWYPYLLFCTIGIMTSFIYSTDMGPWLLDVSDRFAAEFALVVALLYETILSTWFVAKEQYDEVAGPKSVLIHFSTFLIGCWGSALSIALFKPVGMVIGVIFSLGVFIVGFYVALSLAPAAAESETTGCLGLLGIESTKAWNLTLYNVDLLRLRLNDDIRNPDTNELPFLHVPRLWNVLIKYIVPLFGTVLFVSFFFDFDKHYLYPGRNRIFGSMSPFWIIICSFLPHITIIATLYFVFFPEHLKFMQPPKGKQYTFEFPSPGKADTYEMQRRI